MLKKRIVATLVVKHGIVVQSRNFKRYMPVGKPEIAVEFLDDWGVDEIILLDISASRAGRLPDYAMVRSASARCRVPLTVGGGITSIEHILELMHCGAEKVSLNQVALHQPTLIEEAAKLFGDQCIVVSVDTLQVDGINCVYDYLGRKALTIPVEEFARQMQDRGAGEILINSVERDGAQCGFDLDLINAVCSAVTVPVICCGGAGTPQHFIDVLKATNVSAVAASNFFHFTEHSVTTTKALVSQHIPVRHETHARYASNLINTAGRLLKKDDAVLEELLYHRAEKEII
jgi:imidazole glycerol-phosphate synthase subunit HisF